jgi:predicted 3-demethylubiquinone-9 3-methyltransferase (glyoxalase superfamily)
MATLNKITPCLWFDTQAEEAATLYTRLFKNSAVLEVTRYGAAGPRPEGMVMTVRFVLEGQEFMALNGGPEFTFDEAVSFMVNTESQGEADELWERLSEGGEENVCGWLKDKFGLSWQIVPAGFFEIIADPEPVRAQRAMKAMMGMKRLDVAQLRRAAEGE